MHAIASETETTSVRAFIVPECMQQTVRIAEAESPARSSFGETTLYAVPERCRRTTNWQWDETTSIVASTTIVKLSSPVWPARIKFSNVPARNGNLNAVISYSTASPPSRIWLRYVRRWKKTDAMAPSRYTGWLRKYGSFSTGFVFFFQLFSPLLDLTWYNVTLTLIDNGNIEMISKHSEMTVMWTLAEFFSPVLTVTTTIDGKIQNERGTMMFNCKFQ